ncbi:MAG: hypothetical protein HY852_08045 [Bradyrhizobium sp.]|uniref:hypothetical protein n=1 Tax=Bradyrhizobium sp. TaxID=376 RepID=UPI0025BD5FB3|nr:hypothetical protein [Bradyrhizobium sp.]MBI5261752.1 hypothetical protein [Bradyrhizobium sp.]
MIALVVFRILAPWLLKLATRLLARSLNLPEPQLNTTGTFVVTRRQAVEQSIISKFYPFRLARRLRAFRRK